MDSDSLKLSQILASQGYEWVLESRKQEARGSVYASSQKNRNSGLFGAQLFPVELGSGGGLGLKGSCGKTNDPGSWAGFGDS